MRLWCSRADVLNAWQWIYSIQTSLFQAIVDNIFATGVDGVVHKRYDAAPVKIVQTPSVSYFL